jgi:SAM-dependent methyltransferase
VDRSLRGIFDQDAELYDRVRPGYPADLFAQLAELADLGPHRRLLEIGAGTGKATVPLAGTGSRIVAVELGPSMAAVCGRNLAAFPNAQVVNAGFEDWPLPEEPFDVVLAATSWHWLDPILRVAKTVQALRPGGLLAVIETHHVAGGDEGFFADVQACYERYDPTTQPGLRLPIAEEVPRHADTDGSGWFEPAAFHRYQWRETYSTSGYLDLLMSYSNHRALPEPARAGLLRCIANLIDSRYGGRIAKQYLTQLWVARRANGG